MMAQILDERPPPMGSNRGRPEFRTLGYLPVGKIGFHKRPGPLHGAVTDIPVGGGG